MRGDREMEVRGRRSSGTEKRKGGEGGAGGQHGEEGLVLDKLHAEVKQQAHAYNNRRTHIHRSFLPTHRMDRVKKYTHTHFPLTCRLHRVLCSTILHNNTSSVKV